MKILTIKDSMAKLNSYLSDKGINCKSIIGLMEAKWGEGSVGTNYMW